MWVIAIPIIYIYFYGFIYILEYLNNLIYNKHNFTLWFVIIIIFIIIGEFLKNKNIKFKGKF